MRAMCDFFKRLRASSSGNAMVIVAAGMPALIGGAGFAVDMSQWYMWKSELQYATDQAAIAGAYARSSPETEDSYQTRAEQEFAGNLSQTTAFASDPAVRLENWATGTNNSVVVTASATKALPFSSFLTGSATTVRVSSQAAFEKGVTFTSCLIAVDDDACLRLVHLVSAGEDPDLMSAALERFHDVSATQLITTDEMRRVEVGDDTYPQARFICGRHKSRNAFPRY